MTTKQAIRSILKDTDRFIIGDYNGQKWYCPDGHIATIDDIYSQYKPKKSQSFDIDAFRRTEARQPLMDTIIERDGQYVEVEQLNKNLNSDDGSSFYLQAGNTKVLVNKQYYELMQALYPTGVFHIDTAYSYSPIRVVVRDYTKGDLYKIVALIMPLKD